MSPTDFASVSPSFPLPANAIARFYRGSDRMGRFRGVPLGPYDSEDWIGSATEVFGGPSGLGLSRVEDGRSLRALLDEYHAHLLGTAVEWELLVKLLDAGERLPVHSHPTRELARTHLNSVHGKTEAWIVVEAEPDAVVHLGFARDVGRDELAQWVSVQDRDSMLAAMHTVPVRPGNAIVVPAGTPHAIGAGILLVELQEPTDFSVLLESAGYAIDDPSTWELGLGRDVALDSVDRTGWDDARTATVSIDPVPVGAGRLRLFPESADPFFRAERVSAGARLDAAASVLVGLFGSLELSDAVGNSARLAAGESVFVPFGAGVVALDGDGIAIRCLPPMASGHEMVGARS